MLPASTMLDTMLDTMRPPPPPAPQHLHLQWAGDAAP